MSFPQNDLESEGAEPQMTSSSRSELDDLLRCDLAKNVEVDGEVSAPETPDAAPLNGPEVRRLNPVKNSENNFFMLRLKSVLNKWVQIQPIFSQK